MRSHVAFFRRVFGGLGTGGVLASTSAGRIAYRLRVGVTGHRTLPDDPELAARVRQAVERVREIAPSAGSTPVRLAVVSPLAEGADRLVARDILDDPEAILEAVLPLPPDDYLSDFATVESKLEFGELLERARAISVQPGGGTRKEAYERVGRHVVDSCDVVIAIWDGEESRGQGGTADIVQYARDGAVPLLVVDATAPFALTEELHEGIPGEALHELDEYNNAGLGGVDVERNVRERTERLLGADEAKSVRAYLEPFCEWLYPHYVRADELADRAQKEYRRFGNVVLVSAATAVVATAAQVVFAPDRPRLALIEVGLMVFALTAVAAGRRRKPHARWLAHRFLAERFRSALFMALAGGWRRRQPPVAQMRVGRLTAVRKHGKATQEQAEAEQERRDEWVARAFLEVWTQRPVPSSVPSIETLKSFVAAAWIGGQVRYHEAVSERYERRHVWLNRASYLLFGATLVAAAVHASGVGGESHEGLGWSNWLVVLSIGLPAVAGALAAFHAQRQYERNSERSRGMIRRLEAARARLQAATDLDDVRAAAWEIEEIMLDENDDWLVTMRFQDIKASV